MSALPSISLALTPPPAAAPPAPRGAQWLDTATAAARMGVSARRIAQLCASRWSAAKLARFVSGKWEVREDADAMLGRVRWPESMLFEGEKHLTRGQRHELHQRAAIVKGWPSAREAAFRTGMNLDDATRVYCERVSAETGLKVSRGTLYRWHQAWRDEGLAGLVDGRWAQREEKADAFLLEARHWYLRDGSRHSKRDCWMAANLKASEQGWPVRSLDATKRYLSRIPRATAIMRRDGDEAFTNDCEPFGERDYTSIESNDWWNTDHHIFDVIVQAPNGKLCRPWATMIQDVRSRRIVGWVIRCADPNADTIIEAWRIAALAHGIPRKLLMDHGRDFKAASFARVRTASIDNDAPRVKGVLERLGVEEVRAKKYHAQSKPIERFFRTLEEGFGAWWATYTSGGTDTKPEALAGNLKAGKAPTLAAFIAAFEKWLDAGYHRQPHFGSGMAGKTPAAMFDECLVEKRTTTRDALDVLCLKPTKPLRVTQNGVRTDGMTYFDLDLVAKHLGKMVTLRIDGRDIASGVQVFEAESDRFICIALPKKKLPWGATAQELREAHADKAKVRRKVREYVEDVRPRAQEDVVDTLLRARAHAAEQHEAQNPPPTSGGDGPMVIKPVRSSIDDQLPAIRRAKDAQRYRQAAGAEFNPMSLQDVAALCGQGRPAMPEADPFHELAAACQAQPRGE